MFKGYFLLLFLAICNADQREDSFNNLDSGQLADTNIESLETTNATITSTTRKLDPEVTEKTAHDAVNEEDETSIEEAFNFTVPWDTYIALLIKTTVEQLENIKSNMKNNYNLPENDIRDLDASFHGASAEYEHMLQYSLKTIMENKKYNDSRSFLLDFTDLSNYLLERIIEFNLARVNGKLLTQTKWYKQVLRQKILRQQAKIATNHIEAQICFQLSVCKDRWYYSEYLVEWLRHLMNVSPFNLNSFFLAIPNVLENNKHTIKTNLKFKRTVKFIATSTAVVQRDTLDYLDEVITNQKNVYSLVPEILKQGASLLMELFKIIDDNYDMNEENEEQLENVTDMLMDWIDGGSSQIQDVLETILNNMLLNIKIWSLETQRKIDYVWTQITVL